MGSASHEQESDMAAVLHDANGRHRWQQPVAVIIEPSNH